MDPGEFFVRYTAENIEHFPGLVDAVRSFDAGARPSAINATAYLRGVDATKPVESLTRLYFIDGQLVGFYAMSNGEAVLNSRRLKKLGLQRPTQPAVLLTWIAKSAHHRCDGQVMLEHATGQARLAAEFSAATLLALDPFDEDTAAMWRERHGFLEAAPPREGRPKRLIIPLRPPGRAGG